MSDKKYFKIFKWEPSKEELNNQIENYNSLSITKSYKGIASLITLGLVLMGVIVSLFVYETLFSLDIFIGLAIYIILSFFIYKGGHRWAIIALIVVWTYEKIIGIIEYGGISHLLWWIVITPFFYRALRVENEIKKLKPKNTNIDKKENNNHRDYYCKKCGTKIKKEDKFCFKCGNKIN